MQYPPYCSHENGSKKNLSRKTFFPNCSRIKKLVLVSKENVPNKFLKNIAHVKKFSANNTNRNTSFETVRHGYKYLYLEKRPKIENLIKMKGFPFADIFVLADKLHFLADKIRFCEN